MRESPTAPQGARIVFALLTGFLAVIAVTPAASLIVGQPALEADARLEHASTSRAPHRAGDVLVVRVLDETGGAAGELMVTESPPRFEDVAAFATALAAGRDAAARVGLKDGRLAVVAGDPNMRVQVRDAAGNAGSLDFAGAAHDRSRRSEILRKVAHYALSLGFLLGLALPALRRGRAGVESGMADPRFARSWLRGFAVGAGGLLLYIAILATIGQRIWEIEAAELPAAVAGYTLGAVAIGLLEDVTFFGFFHFLAGRRVLVTAAFFAVTHFLHMDKGVDFGTRHLWTGPIALREIFGALAGIVGEPVQLAGLFVVGLVLASLRRATGSVWLGMGLHGGWYFARGVGRKLTDDVEGRADWLFGGNLFYDGLLGFTVLAITGFWLHRGVRGGGGPR